MLCSSWLILFYNMQQKTKFNQFKVKGRPLQQVCFDNVFSVLAETQTTVSSEVYMAFC